jgi:hypothetical protein
MASHSDWELIDNNDWELKKNIVNNNKNNKKIPFVDLIGSINKNNSFSDLMPSLKELPIGLQEGFKGSVGAIPGVENYFPGLSQQTPIPQDIEGAGFARNIGRGIGATPVIGAVGAPLAAAATGFGVPASAAALGGAAFGGGMTTPGDLWHRMVGAGEAVAPLAAGKVISKIPNIWKTVTGKVEPEKLVKNLQKGHDIANKEASDIFDFVKNEQKLREIGKINLSPDLFDEAKNVLSKTRANKKLIEDARSGNYESIHKLQSDLGTFGRAKKNSKFISERKEGDEILDLRDQMNEGIENKFIEKGQIDLAESIKDARQRWAKLKELYYEHPTIGKMVAPKTRKVPKNPISVFSEQSKQMQRIHESHPEIPDMLKIYNDKKELRKQLKKLGLGSAITLPNIAALQFLLGKKDHSSSNEIFEYDKDRNQ